MAEDYERFKRFDYHLNSNLVIQRDSHILNQNEPTGEPESLAGRLRHQMGDKVQRSTPDQLKEKLEKKRQAEEYGRTKRRSGGPASKKFKLGVKRGGTVLDVDVIDESIYKPTTQESKSVYQFLLNEIVSILGDQPAGVLKDAADEIILSCKSSDSRDSQKKLECEGVLGPLSADTFTKLYQLVKQLHDYKTDAEEDALDHSGEGRLDDVTGVAVVFDEDDEPDEEEEEIGIAKDDEFIVEEQDDIYTTQNEDDKYLVTHFDELQDETEDQMNNADDDKSLHVRQIDAHWLQRELGNLYADPQLAVEMEKQILNVLLIPELQACENKLVYLLKYDNFKFAKKILHNRWKVYYCTRLGQAQGPAEREEILNEMKSTQHGQSVLEQLESVKLRVNKEREFARSVRKEAATLAEKSNAAAIEVKPEDQDTEEFGSERINRHQSTPGTKDADIGDQEMEGLKPSNFLDLEALAFQDGGRLMANSMVKLHDNSQRVEKKAYDEVVVPPIKKTDEDSKMDGTTDRMPVADMPEWTRAAFISAGIEKLNPIQTKVYPIAYESPSKNMLVCAPTGAGKTNIAMLTILSVLSQHRDSESGIIDKRGFKIVYISPMKALVAEQVAAFQKRLDGYGLQVRELTGDANLTRQQIEDTQVIVTTPEKWDVVTRKAGDRLYTQLVRLVIIDEIHLLHDSRGPVLEALVARTLRQIESTQEYIRLVGLSATLPNYQDVAIFLRIPLKENEGLFVFGNHHRPVPLLQTYIGLKEKKAMKRLTTMNRIVYEKVLENAGRNQVLVFVHSRRETVRTARMLRQMAMDEDTLARFLEEGSASREILFTEAEALKTHDLKDLLPYGFAVHHAGLPRTDRRLIEDLFADRHVQVLVSTATLAWGVNLPAHTVIIKGTQVYVPEKGGWKELSPLDVMQMMGRAGRPQYDTSGHGIIITNHSELQFYLSLNNQQLPIESQLISMLPDLLNAEIVLGTIRSRMDAVNWLGYTYLFVRLLRNPVLYGFPEDIYDNDPELEQARTDIAHSALTLLDRHGLIRYDKRTGSIQVTALGKVASHYYIKHPSVAVYNEHLRPSFTDIELLRVFSLSNEFKYIPVREEEKVELAKLIERVPIPVKGGSTAGTVEETSSKVNVLLQAYISQLRLDGFALASDMTYIHQSAGRIVRALFEIAIKRGWACLSMRALLFCKMISRRMWSTMSPLRQFPGALSEEVLRRLEKKDFPWQRYFDLTSAELGELIRNPKLGKVLHRLVHSVPKVDLSAYVQPLSRSTLLVEVTVTPDFRWDSKYHDVSGEAFWIIVEDGDGETILHHEMIMLKSHQVSQEDFELTIDFAVPITEPLPPNYFLRCVSDKWLQSEALLPISFHNLILPEKNPPHTELLDLQALPVVALRYPQAEPLFCRGHTDFFDPIQTQVFSALNNSDENVLICAPPSPEGLRTCAEIAILRVLKNEAIQRCVYVVPFERCAHRRAQEWKERLGKTLNMRVCELTGDVAVDLRLIGESNLIISTPERWDFVSRRWRTRRVLQQIRLFICDELELLDSPSGAAFEVCMSRIRYLSAQLPNPIRMIGLSVSLANAADLAEWFGVGTSGFFNFHASVRPSALEVSLQAFDIHHRPSRLLAMSKPVYQSIKKNCGKGKRAIVFCPDRKQARITAVDLLLYAAADDLPKRFLHATDSEIEQLIQDMPEKSLKHALSRGVGYIHEGLTENARIAVENLYTAGVIQIIVVSEGLLWDLALTGDLVVVQETTKYDAKQKRFIDYSMIDVLRMISRAGSSSDRPEGSTVAILCSSSKKEYYKKFVFEPLPVESRLDQHLADHINAEVTLKTIESKQDAVDWLTWTLYYRRLTKNPNFYGLQGVSHTHLSEHLSEIVETAIETLESAQCLAVDPEDGSSLTVLNLGLVAAFYYIRFSTVELMNRTVTATTKRKGLVEIVCSAAEFGDVVTIRFGEENIMKKLAKELSVRLGQDADVNDPHIKALLLLYAHFHRTPLTTDLAYDQIAIIEEASRLLHALVDVISSNGWLAPALLTMELNQMVIQALQPAKSSLFQLPHFDDERVEKAKEAGFRDIIDLINAEDDERDAVLSGLTEKQIENVALACNRYPVVNVEYEIQGITPSKEKDSNVFAVTAGKPATLIVNIEREADFEDWGPVIAPYYPKQKDEQWWLVVGNPKSNLLMAIKRITINKSHSTVKLDIDIPEAEGRQNLVLNLMCDSYVGCDQEYELLIDAQ